MGKIKWTDAQKSIIEKRNCNLLVSAGAGSGKTTVMIERIANLILDKEKPTPISRFLIISFTKASAADMKNKLVKKLSEMEPTPYILEQLDDVLTSDVSNLHSFCARLLKSYFYEVGLDPTFVVLDETETDVLKQKALSKLFEQKTQSANQEFYALIDIFAKKRKDTGLKDVILKIHNFMCSIDNKDEWFERTINTLYETDLENNVGAKIIMSHLVAEKRRMLAEISKMKEECRNNECDKLVSYLDALESKVLLIREDQNLKQNAKRLQTIERLPTIPAVDKKIDWLKAKVGAFKDVINKRMAKLQEYVLAEDVDNVELALQKTQKHVFELYKLEKEFVEIFENLKKERGGLDFNDLEENTLKVLSNPIMLEEIRNKYDYIMVDEYQDINSVQEKILSLLSKDDNRFMVGDVKQSIYRFRLCDPQIFLDKYNSYKNNPNAGTLIKLNENFRSKKTILDFANAIFAETMTEDFGGVNYAQDAMLIAGSDAQKDDKVRAKFLLADTGAFEKQKQSEFSVYSVKEDDQSAFLEKKGRAEGLLIADEILELMGKEKVSSGDKTRKIKFSDITILVPSRTAYLDKIVETLRAKDIPVATDVEGDCFDDEYVFGLKSFLEVLSCEKVDYSLFSLMKSKVFDFSANELAEICEDADSKKFFYENLDVVCKNRKLSSKSQQKLDYFFEKIKKYREKAKFLNAKEIVLQIMKEQNLMAKISFEVDGDKTKQKLSRFLSDLENKTIFEFLNDASLASIKCDPVYAEDAVKVMTIHKSKGLEFKVVFLAMCAKEFNLESVKSSVLISKDLGIAMDFYDSDLRYKTPTLAKQAVRLLETRKMLEEEQRLLYVALTRATDFLFVVASTEVEAIHEKMPASPMCFLDFCGHLIKDTNKYDSLPYQVKIVDALSLLKNDTAKEFKQIILEKQEIDENLKNILDKPYPFEEDVHTPLKVAVTGILKGEIENQSFTQFFDDEETENSFSSSAKEGTLYHMILANLDLSKTSKKEIDDQILKFEENGIVSKEEAETINTESLSKLLSNIEFQNMLSGADEIFKEKEFFCLHKNRESSSSVMQGIVDLLVVKNNKLIIVDYKTGNLQNKEKFAKYCEQVKVYANAMERCFGLETEKMCIASINTGKLFFVKND